MLITDNAFQCFSQENDNCQDYSKGRENLDSILCLPCLPVKEWSRKTARVKCGKIISQWSFPLCIFFTGEDASLTKEEYLLVPLGVLGVLDAPWDPAMVKVKTCYEK